MTGFTIASVLAWARTKPADERYCYNSNGFCALARFLVETGRATNPVVGSSVWRDGDVSNVLPVWANAAASANCDEIAWTFGAFVERLEKVAADQLVMA